MSIWNGMAWISFTCCFLIREVNSSLRFLFPLFQCEEVEGSGDPLDISRLSESLARATCVALVPYIDLLAAANLSTLGVRAQIHPDNVSTFFFITINYYSGTRKFFS